MRGVIARIAGDLMAGWVWRVVAGGECAASRGLRSPTQSGRIRKEILGSSRLPGGDQTKGTTACVKSVGALKMFRGMRRKIRTIWSRLIV